jgi:hypothetical protein
MHYWPRCVSAVRSGALSVHTGFPPESASSAFVCRIYETLTIVKTDRKELLPFLSCTSK